MAAHSARPDRLSDWQITTMNDDTELRHPGIYAEKTPDRPAVIMGDSSEVVTFAEYEATSNQCAHLLRACGLKRGDRVAILMENNALYLPLAWGGWRAGLRVTAIATHLSADEVDYILEDSGASALLTSAAMCDKAVALKAICMSPNNKFMARGSAPGFNSLEDGLATHLETPIADQSEGVEMLYSSGTTGRPKGIKKVLPDIPFGVPTPWHRTMVELYGVDENTVYLTPAPLYHAAPLMYNLRFIRYGATSVIMEKFDAEAALALIERHHVTHSQWVPTHFIRMLRLPAETRRRYDLSSHRIALHAAAPCPVEIKKQMLEWWGPMICEYYGASEGNGYVAINAEEWLSRPGSVGRAMIGKIRICDDQGRELPTGSEGAIYFEDGPVFAYHNDPEKTARSRNAQGWSTVGDVGTVDEEGYLYLTDRKAFMIISGGVNIYPQEVEDLLASHPKVLDVAVIGVPNFEFGEEVKAVVRPDRMQDAGPELRDELIAHCRANLSPVKCPRSVDFVEQLPRQANGKLYKRKLREAYWPGGDG